MSDATTLTMAAVSLILSLPVIALALFWRYWLNRTKPFARKVDWPIWFAFPFIPVLFFFLINWFSKPTPGVTYVSNEFEMFDRDAGLVPDGGFEALETWVAEDNVVEAIKHRAKFAADYALTGYPEMVTIEGVQVMKVPVFMDSEMVALGYLEPRGGRLFGLVCMRKSLVRIFPDDREQCQQRLVEGRAKVGSK